MHVRTKSTQEMEKGCQEGRIIVKHKEEKRYTAGRRRTCYEAGKESWHKLEPRSWNYLKLSSTYRISFPLDEVRATLSKDSMGGKGAKVLDDVVHKRLTL